MRSAFTRVTPLLVAVGLLVPSSVFAQINFVKSGYYLSMGDSVAAGEGALPVTHGFVYQLYDRGVFGRLQEIDFSNIAIKGATALEVQAFQVPQAVCIQPPRILVAPSVITLTAGANDFEIFLATHDMTDPASVAQIPAVADGIAATVESVIRSLVFGISGQLSCPGIPGVTVLVSNYYSFNHPDPTINAVLNLALTTFGTSLQARVAQIQADILSTPGNTARVGYVDTYAAMFGRTGLLLIERRNGFNGGLDFEIHPTNAGHTVIAEEFEKVWKSLQ